MYESYLIHVQPFEWNFVPNAPLGNEATSQQSCQICSSPMQTSVEKVSLKLFVLENHIDVSSLLLGQYSTFTAKESMS